MEDMTQLREEEIEQGYDVLEDDQYGALVLFCFFLVFPPVLFKISTTWTQTVLRVISKFVFRPD